MWPNIKMPPIWPKACFGHYFEADTETLSANAREKVVKTYAQEIVSAQYKQIYAR